VSGSWARLSAADRNYLRLETAETPMHVAALARLEAGALLDATGRLRLQEVRARLELRTRRLPALRRVLYRPGPPLGSPIWTDDGAFEIAHHVHEARLAGPGGEEEVLHCVEDLVARRLDRGRPLWEVWFLTGLASGEVGVLIELHHAVADGLAALEILGALFDLAPDTPDPPAAPPAPNPAPGGRELLRDNAARRAAACRRAVAWLSRPKRLGAAAAAARRDLAGSRGAPATSLNRPVGRGRRLAVLRLPLEDVRAAGHAHGATVNDVILTLAAAGLADVLRGRGEPVEGMALHASVAATLRTAADAGELGNRVGSFLLPLPVGELAEGERLEAVGARMRAARSRQAPATSEALMTWFTGTRLARAWFRRQRLVNVLETDLPGPPTAAYLLGARVLDLVPITALAGNVTMVFAALSHAGRLAVTACTDASGGRDLPALQGGMERAWGELRAGSQGPQPPASEGTTVAPDRG
jgi:WS/DGAT/MGAT family acyltransferase